MKMKCKKCGIKDPNLIGMCESCYLNMIKNVGKRMREIKAFDDWLNEKPGRAEGMFQVKKQLEELGLA